MELFDTYFVWIGQVLLGYYCCKETTTCIHCIPRLFSEYLHQMETSDYECTH